MVHSFVRLSLIPSLLLALFLSYGVSLYSATRTVQVDDICSKHTNPSSCVFILNSIPGVAAGADPNTLSPEIINIAHVNAFNTLAQIHNLIQNTTNPQLKQRYASCSMDYNDVLLCLSQAKQSFSSGDYKGMNSNGASVIKDVQDCDSKPPSDPSALPTDNDYFKDVSGIIMILADFLTGIY